MANHANNHGHHAQSFHATLAGIEHQLTIAISDPSSHLSILAIAIGVIIVGFLLLGRVGAVGMKTMMPGTRGSLSGGGSVGDTIAQGAATGFLFLLALTLPIVIFTPMLNHGAAAVSQILGG